MTSHHFQNSSSISSCHYDARDKILYINFNSGQTHSYEDCPINVYEGLVSAKSAGGFFHAHIRDKFKSQKV